jgi:RimJ/RimL family protein N-acetyltransferase
MGAPSIRPFEPADLLACVNRDGWQGATLQMAEEQAKRGPAFTFVQDGRIIGVTGVVVPWPGVGTAWMALTDHINGHRIWLTKVSQAVLRHAVQAHQLHRLEATVLADSERNQRWLEALGFSREQDGRARAYTALGADMVRYERILEWRDDG